MIDLESLNDNQRQAVEWDRGPLLVLAGPGSGKTKVLTLRIARLIEDSPNEHFVVLGLTFTNKAAKEMRERIENIVPNARERIVLATFHSFAADILRQHGHFLGLKPGFTILSLDDERKLLLDEAIIQADLPRSYWNAERLLPCISSLTADNVIPEASETILRERLFDNPEEISAIYKNYRKLMLAENMLDFDGLIAETLGLLEKQPKVREHIHIVFPYICVDEFQDTNLSQYKILRQLINEKTKNLFAVADDDQIIYQWNGADPERLNQLRNDYDMEVLQLPENYRCPAEVIDLANRLIENNSRFAFKHKLKAAKKEATNSVKPPLSFETFDAEVAQVSQFIANQDIAVREKCVILARDNKILEEFITGLGKLGIHGYLGARKNEFESAPLQWVYAALLLANSDNNRLEVPKICKAFYDLEGININSMDVISHAGTEGSGYLRSWVDSVLQREDLSEQTRDFFEASLKPCLLDRLDFRSFLSSAFTWLDSLHKDDGIHKSESAFDEYETEKATWGELVAEIDGRHGREQVTLNLLMHGISLSSKSSPPPDGAVPCFTVHAAKGLEFDHVYLVGMMDKRFPSFRAVKEGDHSPQMQEERRNCFVAITRTQRTLTMTYSREFNGYPQKASRFLSEMGFECL